MLHSSFKHVNIKGISVIIPSNMPKKAEDKLQFFNNNLKRLEKAQKYIGYGDTYISPHGLTVSDICEKAANDLINEMNIDKNSIDALVFVSQYPDYDAPATAQVLHGKLGLKPDCLVFDVNQGCTGYIYGLNIASSLIESGAVKRVLLLSGDNISEDLYSRNIKDICLLFSSAGTATLLEYSNEEIQSEYFIETYGSDFESLITPAGGFRIPITSENINIEIEDGNGNKRKLTDNFADGLAVFDFTNEKVKTHLATILKNNISIDEIDFVAIHQGNKQIVESMAEFLMIPPQKICSETFTKYGNTSMTSCLINLIDGYNNGDINNSKIFFSSFGMGLSIASAYIKLAKIHCKGIKMHYFENIKSVKEYEEYWIEKIKNYKGV